MEEVQEAVRDAAMKRFEIYAEKAVHYTPVFKQVGMQMILFAKEEPMLYKLGFMTNNHNIQKFEDIYERLGVVAYQCLDVIQHDYGLSEKEARVLFEIHSRIVRLWNMLQHLHRKILQVQRALQRL